MGRTFYIYKHRDKGAPFIAHLVAAGWTRVSAPDDASIILADLEGFGRSGFLNHYHVRNFTPTVLYPHGPAASCSWNFPGTQYFDFVASVLIPSYGQAQVMSAYGCPYSTFETGWPYGAQRNFQPTRGRSILFAPIHPNSNGYLCKVDRDMNARAFQILMKLQRLGDISLTVRYLFDLRANGLWREPDVNFVTGVASMTEAKLAIDDCDLVVGHHTLAHLAIAMGKPTLMFGEHVAPHYGGSEQDLVYVTSWPKYRHLMAFPLDLFLESDKIFLIQRACYSDYEIQDWKARMIGSPFNAEAYVTHMENIADGRKERTVIAEPVSVAAD